MVPGLSLLSTNKALPPGRPPSMWWIQMDSSVNFRSEHATIQSTMLPTKK